LMNRMHGELDNLYQMLVRLSLLKDGKKKGVKEALARLMAAFPIYRIYSQSLPLESEDAEQISEAFARVEDRFPKLKEPLAKLEAIFSPSLSGKKDFDGRRMHFIKRWQQFTGPLAAKGGEDTSFYIFHRLISRNEVGDNPSTGTISLEAFHRKMVERNKLYPHALSGTSTHDTKRGEDSRMRLNVLSEMPDEWANAVLEWKELNKSFVSGKGPDSNVEYFLYQTLVGLWPMSLAFKKSHFKRLSEYLSKALREAKVQTSWSDPDEEYEKAIISFAGSITQKDSAFTDSFKKFIQPVVRAGVINSLSQVVIKHTAPGIPDVYQGCEGWDLSLVDPDNRRPVDYDKWKKELKKVKKSFSSNFSDTGNELLSSFKNGNVKMFLTWRLLQLRKRNTKFFEKANYIPVEVDEDGEIVAYLRRSGNKWLFVLCLLRPYKYLSAESSTLSVDVDSNVYPDLPDKAPNKWTNLFTGTHYESMPSVRELLSSFPVVCLVSDQLKL
ncbi:MAG: 4-alpha-glucanotransferase, partial [Cyclobacteriaceae bacterium]